MMVSRLLRSLSAALLLVSFHLPAVAQELSMAIQPDIPPYVMKDATSGLEVDLVHAVLPDRELRFTQMPYADLETAVQRGRAEAALAVQGPGEGVSYSKPYLTFVNDAISKKADGLELATVADLRGHKVLTWEDAYRELGAPFEAQYSPQSPERSNYIEFADQQEQVRTFWAEKGSVAVIDRSIFEYYSEQMGHSMTDVVFHPLFPVVTNFKAGFKETAVRDEFDAGFAKVCKSGEYARILKRYGVDLPRSVCD